jgi:DNA-binding NarL/FixJ family response regulator
METILIADDHGIVRQGVRMIIEGLSEKYNCVEASSCEEVQKIFSEQKIHYAVLDLFLIDGNLYPVIVQMLKSQSPANMLIYSMNAERVYAKRLLEKGVKGFVSKQADFEQLEQAINCLLNDEIYMSPELMQHLFNADKSRQWDTPINKLSDRELEVAEYSITGLGTKEIASRMDLDIATVSIHKRKALDKLNAKNMMELKEIFLLYKMPPM